MLGRVLRLFIITSHTVLCVHRTNNKDRIQNRGKIEQMLFPEGEPIIQNSCKSTVR